MEQKIKIEDIKKKVKVYIDDKQIKNILSYKIERSLDGGKLTLEILLFDNEIEIEKDKIKYYKNKIIPKLIGIIIGFLIGTTFIKIVFLFFK